MEKAVITINEENEDTRIDKLLSELVEDMSRTAIKKLIDSGLVCVNNKAVKGSFKGKDGDIVEIIFPEPMVPEILPENIPLDILYEDMDVIVVNKPKDMVVHPAAGHYSGTLVNALMYHCKDSLSGINGIMRPGIVHRIDKDTTGAIIACKNDFAHNAIAEQLKVHSINRRYLALSCGNFKEDFGRVEGNIGRDPKDRKKMAITPQGKPAITNFTVLDHLDKKVNLIECRLETGRTHQIRVHMSSLGHPLLGDEIYGGFTRKNLQGQCLHAKVLGFMHPRTGEYIECIAPNPSYFDNLINIYKSNLSSES